MSNLKEQSRTLLQSQAAPGWSARAEAWLRDFESAALQLPPAESLTLLATYDHLHRRRRHRAPAALLSRIIHAALAAHLRGDADVDPHLLFTHIGDALESRHDATMLGRPLRWYSQRLAQWHTLSETPDFWQLPTAEIRRIATHLLSADLYPFTPDPAAYKHRLSPRIASLPAPAASPLTIYC